MSDGPTLWPIATLCCSGCTKLDTRLARSGRNPEYGYYCRHPDIIDDTPEILRRLRPAGRYIGTTDDTPTWCPFRRES